MTPPDVALFEQWSETRNADVFAEIVSRYSGMVYGTCTRILGNPTEAEDVAQECFVELAQSDAPVKWSLGGWLHTMATRRSLDRIKAERRRKDRESQFAAKTEAYVAPDWDDLKGYVDEEIAALPEELRTPIVGRFLEGQTHDAIAKQLGVSRSTVQYRQEKGLEEIRKRMKRRGVVLGLAALTGLFHTHLAEAAAMEAVPASLTAALGRLAIAASMRTVRPAVVAAGSLVSLRLATLGAAFGAAVLATTLFVVGVMYRFDHGTDVPEISGVQAPAAAPKAAQTYGPGTVQGRVFTPDGDPAVGATVLLMSLSPLFLDKRICDDKGRFEFASVPLNASYVALISHEATHSSAQVNVGVTSAAPVARAETRLVSEATGP